MRFPEYRPRRLRKNDTLRKMVRETQLEISDFILPLFVVEGKGIKNPLESLPGQFQYSTDVLVKEAHEVVRSGVPAVILFGVPLEKDAVGSQAYAKEGVTQRAIRGLKNAYPELIVITDVCLCEYTDHGHCGIISHGEVDNDSTLDILAKVSLSHVQAGADMVAPSDMMDGRVSAHKGSA